MSTQTRKSEHLRICAEKNVLSSHNFFDDICFVHDCLPELDLNKIDIKTRFLGKKFDAPLMIASMTGGTNEAKKINENLAGACQKKGIGFGAGSQRAGIENKKLEDTYNVRHVAKDIFVYANLGAVQMNCGYSFEKYKKAAEMINADAVAVHLNALQESVQKEGDVNFENILEKIKETCSKISFPVIAKETGAGINYENSMKLKEAGVKALMTDGLGGTSWSLVEHYRGSEKAFLFKDWGIPSPVCIKECSKTGLPVVAGGGIRNGLDIAKALALGADIAQSAIVFLAPSMKSQKDVEKKIESMMRELKTAMFLTGSKNINELRKKKLIIKGELKDWFIQLSLL